MNIYYHDIISKINEPPQWYDDKGVPRYCPFSPFETGVYVCFAVLVAISCQSCGQKFNVGIGYDPFYNKYIKAEDVNDYTVNDYTVQFSKNSLENICKGFHYGDPPAHGCVGDTMNCLDDEILQAWCYETKTEESNDLSRVVAMPEWKRRPDLEGPLPELGSPTWYEGRGWDPPATNDTYDDVERKGNGKEHEMTTSDDGYPLHVFNLKNTGLGVRGHDPEHRVNAAVPEGKVGISWDTGFAYEAGRGVYPTDRAEVALLVGSRDELVKELEKILKVLKIS